jgi:hypothetical protein
MRLKQFLRREGGSMKTIIALIAILLLVGAAQAQKVKVAGDPKVDLLKYKTYQDVLAISPPRFTLLRLQVFTETLGLLHCLSLIRKG